MKRLQVGMLVAGIGCCMTWGVIAGNAAERLSRPAPPPSTSEIEDAIHALREPFDYGQLNKVSFDLARIEDATERERLQKILDERVRELMKIPEVPEPAKDVKDLLGGAEAANDVALQTELPAQIDMLHLGPQATADELRARDELVLKIAQVRDPVKRDELLERLENREHDALIGEALTNQIKH